MNNKLIGKWLKPTIALAVIIVLYYFLWTNNPNFDIESIQEFVDKYEPYSALVYILIGSFRTIFFIPTPILFIAGGIMFGTLMGIIYTIIGVIVSTSICYLLARRYKSFFAKFTNNWVNDRIESIDNNRVMGTIFTMRAIPGIPYDAVSFSAGIVNLNLGHLLIGTVLGILPKAIILGSLGDNLDNIFSLKVILGYILVILICLVLLYSSPKKHIQKAYKKACSKQ